MSDLIRMYGMKVAHSGACRKCGQKRDKGNHSKCDRWPNSMSISRGFHYVSNSEESTLADLKSIVAAITNGDVDDTPVQFEIRIRQVLPKTAKEVCEHRINSNSSGSVMAAV